jgi:hypothetical protein
MPTLTPAQLRAAAPHGEQAIIEAVEGLTRRSMQVPSRGMLS